MVSTVYRATVILLFENQGMAPSWFRANIVAYFTIVTLVAVLVFSLDGDLTHDIASLTAVTVPATISEWSAIALHRARGLAPVLWSQFGHRRPVRHDPS